MLPRFRHKTSTVVREAKGTTPEGEMNNQKLGSFVLCDMLLVLCFTVEAQQPGKVHRIGYLTRAGSPPAAPAFVQGLRDLGHIEGKNIIIEHRSAGGSIDRLPDLAAKLVGLKVDVIVTVGGTATLPAKQATGTIPIVFTLVSDPVREGLVTSLARPGGNVTGLSAVSQDLSGKRLELLKEAIPKASIVGVLYDPNDPAKIAEFKEIEVVARFLGVQPQSLEVRSLDEVENAFKTATRAKAAAILVLPTSILNAQYKRISELAANNRLPTMFASSLYMDAGGLMSYGPDFADLYRRAATYVDKILKGAKPADLPVEQPTKFELVINLKTAKQISLTIPPNVLARADKVIK
jgi:putative ABC transport system substrate-binding protein